MRFLFLVTPLLLSSCGVDEELEDYIDLVIENRTGAQLWYFDYSGCGEDYWYEVIGSDEYVADGTDVGAYDLEPGCYDLYVEDEWGCWAENRTDGNVSGGTRFIWTVTESDLICK